MKKMKKLVATLVCLVMAIATLSGCTGNTGNNNKPTTEPTEKPTTEVVTTEPTVTEETTTEPTTEPTTVEPTDTQSGDVIIPLYNYIYADQIRQMSPESVAGDFFNSIAPYMSVCEVQSSPDATVYCLAIDSVPHDTFELSNVAGTTSASVGVLLVVSSEGIVATSFNTSTGENDSLDFIPLFYNSTKKCLVGYSGYNTGNPGFREVYWDVVHAVPVDVDQSLYSF